MKKALLAAVFAVVVSGASFAEGGALAELKLKAPGYAESVSLPTPKAAAVSIQSGLDKLRAEMGLQDATPYEILRNLYLEGIPATEMDLTGWHAGRTVEATKPEVFQGALIVGVRLPVNSAGGPLFQEMTKFRLNSLASDAAYNYDEMSVAKVEEVKKQLAEGFKLSFEPGKAPAGSMSYSDGSSVVVVYKKARGYVVESWTKYDKDGKIFADFYSYFFRDVTPK